jgi:hypothetical protein
MPKEYLEFVCIDKDSHGRYLNCNVFILVYILDAILCILEHVQSTFLTTV